MISIPRGRIWLRGYLVPSVQKKPRPLRMQRTGRFVFMEKGRGTNYFILLLAFMRCSWLRICLRMRRFSGVTSSSSS